MFVYLEALIYSDFVDNLICKYRTLKKIFDSSVPPQNIFITSSSPERCASNFYLSPLCTSMAYDREFCKAVFTLS